MEGRQVGTSPRRPLPGASLVQPRLPLVRRRVVDLVMVSTCLCRA